METVRILSGQTALMFMLMLVGFILYRIKMIDSKISGAIGNIVLYVANPAVILSSLLTGFSSEKLVKGGIAVILSIGAVVVGIVVGILLYRRGKPINKFAIAFGNNGFIGIPLIQNVMGPECVFYVTISVAIQAVAMWTYGVIILSGDKREASIKKVATNPCILAMVIGIIVGFTGVTLPNVLSQTVTYLGNMNTPLAMIVLGSYLAETDVRLLLRDKDLYISSVGRLVIVPIVCMFMTLLVPVQYSDVVTTILIAAATPVAGSLAIYCKRYDNNYAYGAGIVGLTTLFGLVTMPIFLYVTYLF